MLRKIAKVYLLVKSVRDKPEIVLGGVVVYRLLFTLRIYIFCIV